MLSFLKNKFLEPLAEFIHDSKAIGIILLSCTFLSLLLSNISFTQNWYTAFWNIHFNGTTNHLLQVGFLHLPNSPLLIINDFFMAFFFFLAGMEIKRELVSGELSSFRKSLLPIIAAIGGMLVPAILFSQFNKGTIFIKGWAIPTATDIAFTLGVASLLGNKVPTALKIFITALAIIDDLGAVIIIALFYGEEVKLAYLLCSIAVIIVLAILNFKQKKIGFAHIILGLVLWYCMFNSGIHATIAGVIMALFIPIKKLNWLELKLHNWVYFLIMPLFALANTAIIFPEKIATNLSTSLSWGIIVGLCIGKPLGISLTCFLAIKKKICVLPSNTNWLQLFGVSILAGIGFTMSIFIATLAFDNSAHQNISKISVLIASFLAIVVGFFWLKFSAKKTVQLPS